MSPERESRPVVGTGSLNVTGGDPRSVPRQGDKNRPPTVVPRVVSIFTTRGGQRMLMIVRCECGWHHQHTAAPTFAEGTRKGGCGRRYVLRVAAVRAGEAA